MDVEEELDGVRLAAQIGILVLAPERDGRCVAHLAEHAQSRFVPGEAERGRGVSDGEPNGRRGAPGTEVPVHGRRAFQEREPEGFPGAGGLFRRGPRAGRETGGEENDEAPSQDAKSLADRATALRSGIGTGRERHADRWRSRA